MQTDDRTSYGLKRPLNETGEDLDREYHAMKFVESKTNSKGIKLSETLYGIDWFFHKDNKPNFLGEYKFRNTKYDTLIISAGKVKKGFDLGAALKLPFFLFIEWPDEIRFFGVMNLDLRVVVGGNSRGQSGDIEPCYDIPLKLFKRFERL